MRTRDELTPEEYGTDAAAQGQCDCACQAGSALLSAWIHLSDACNLSCAYCYLAPAPRHMSPETGRAVIDSILRAARANTYPAIKLKYAGGEPLLRFTTLLELHEYARAAAARAGLGLQGVVLSNGTTLSARKAAQIRAAGLRLMISLDGIGAYHDAQRHFAGGRGSFALTVQGIHNALAAGLTPELSITVSSRSIAGLPELMEWVLERGLPFSINFYRKNQRSAGLADLDLEEDALLTGMRAALRVIAGNLPRRSLLAALTDRADLAAPHSHPCAAGHDYLVFDPQGRVALCQMQMEQVVSDCCAADPLADVRAAGRAHNPAVEQKDECQQCQWRHFCAGGCPLQALQTAGSRAAKSPNCRIYQALFPEVLALEALRLARQKAALPENGRTAAALST